MEVKIIHRKTDYKFSLEAAALASVLVRYPRYCRSYNGQIWKRDNGRIEGYRRARALGKEMSKKTIFILAVCYALGAFAIGYAVARKNNEESTTEMKTEASERVIERVETVVRKPNGTVILKVENRKKENKISEDKTERKEVKAAANYSLGVRFHLLPLREIDRNYEVILGKRVVGSLWGEVGARQDLRQFSLGLRMEF